MNFAGIFMAVTVFFFVSKLMGKSISPYLAQYGGDYFAFVLIGIALSGFLTTGLGVFSSSVSSAQSTGTLEAMLVTPTSLPEIVLLSSLYSFIFTALNVLVYLIFGVAVFGLDLGRANVPAAMLVLLLMVLVFSGLGIIAASFVMLFKRGDPVGWIFGSVSSVMGGTFFPVQILPAWLQKLSYLFPVFYGLRAMRLALLKGVGLAALAPDIAALAAFAALIVPLSLWSFSLAVRRAKIDGSLATY
ncbi:MAG: ABC transporter permease [Actinobacteria bacterium]|nr:MAG: ABC transporter permease [Actinomycetota bacterium]